MEWITVEIAITLGVVVLTAILLILLYCLCRSKNKVYDHTCVALLHPEEEKELGYKPIENGKTTKVYITGHLEEIPLLESKLQGKNLSKEKVDKVDGNELKSKRGSKRDSKRAKEREDSKDELTDKRGSREYAKTQKNDLNIATRNDRRNGHDSKEIKNEMKNEKTPSKNKRRESEKLQKQDSKTDKKQYEKNKEIKYYTEPPEIQKKRNLKKDLKPYNIMVEVKNETKFQNTPLPEFFRQTSGQYPDKCPLSVDENSLKKTLEKSQKDSERLDQSTRPYGDTGAPHYLHPSSFEERTLTAKEKRDQFARSDSVFKHNLDDPNGGSLYRRPRSLDILDSRHTNEDYYDKPRESLRLPSHYVTPKTLEREEREKRDRDLYYVRPRSLDYERPHKKRESERLSSYHLSSRALEMEEVGEREPHYVYPRALDEKDKRGESDRPPSQHMLPQSLDEFEKNTPDTYFFSPRALEAEERKKNRDYSHTLPRSLGGTTEDSFANYMSPKSPAFKDNDSLYVHPPTLERHTRGRSEHEDYYVSPRSFDKEDGKVDESYYVHPRTLEQNSRGSRDRDEHYIKPRSIEHDSYYVHPRTLEKDTRSHNDHVSSKSFENERGERDAYYVRPRTFEKDTRNHEEHYVKPQSFENDRESYYVHPRTFEREKRGEMDRRGDRRYASDMNVRSHTMSHATDRRRRPQSAERTERRNYPLTEGQRSSAYYLSPHEAEMVRTEPRSRPSSGRSDGRERSNERRRSGRSEERERREMGNNDRERRGRSDERERREGESRQRSERSLERDKGESSGERDRRKRSNERGKRERSGERKRREDRTNVRYGTEHRDRSHDRSLTDDRREMKRSNERGKEERDRIDEKEKRDEWEMRHAKERGDERDTSNERKYKNERDGRESSSEKRLKRDRDKDEREKRDLRDKREERERNGRERSFDRERNDREKKDGGQSSTKRERKQSRERSAEREKKDSRDDKGGTERRSEGESRRERQSRTGEPVENRSRDPSTEKTDYRSWSPKRPVTQDRRPRSRLRSHSVENLPSTLERKQRQFHVIQRTKSWASRPKTRADSPPMPPKRIQLEFHPLSGHVTPLDTKSNVFTEPQRINTAENLQLESSPLLDFEKPPNRWSDNTGPTNSPKRFDFTDDKKWSGSPRESKNSSTQIYTDGGDENRVDKFRSNSTTMHRKPIGRAASDRKVVQQRSFQKESKAMDCQSDSRQYSATLTNRVTNENRKGAFNLQSDSQRSTPTMFNRFKDDDVRSWHTAQSDSRRSSTTMTNSVLNEENGNEDIQLENDADKTLVSGSLLIEYSTNKQTKALNDYLNRNKKPRPRSAEFFMKSESFSNSSYDSQSSTDDYRVYQNEVRKLNGHPRSTRTRLGDNEDRMKKFEKRGTSEKAFHLKSGSASTISDQEDGAKNSEKLFTSEKVVNLKATAERPSRRVSRSSLSSEDVDWHLYTVDGKKIVRSQPEIEIKIHSTTQREVRSDGELDWHDFALSYAKLKQKRDNVTGEVTQENWSNNMATPKPGTVTQSRDETDNESVTQYPTVLRKGSRIESRSRGNVRASLESPLKNSNVTQSRNSEYDLKPRRTKSQPIIFQFE